MEQVGARAVPLFQEQPDLIRHLPMFLDKTPVRLSQDSPEVIVRKLGRTLMSSRIILASINQLATTLEWLLPKPRILLPLYRWIIGAHIYRGYRRGIRTNDRIQIPASHASGL